MSELRIDVADLLRRPGTRRDITLRAELDALRGSSAVIEGPVDIDASLERVSEGIVVRGDLAGTWSAQCSVCLRQVEHELTVHVAELFEPSPVEGETYPLEGHELDLEQLVRDVLLLELPLAPHCASPCAPAPTGSADDTVADLTELDEHEEPADPRWAPLAELEL